MADSMGTAVPFFDQRAVLNRLDELPSVVGRVVVLPTYLVLLVAALHTLCGDALHGPRNS